MLLFSSPNLALSVKPSHRIERHFHFFPDCKENKHFMCLCVSAFRLLLSLFVLCFISFLKFCSCHEITSSQSYSIHSVYFFFIFRWLHFVRSLHFTIAPPFITIYFCAVFIHFARWISLKVKCELIRKWRLLHSKIYDTAFTADCTL